MQWNHYSCKLQFNSSGRTDLFIPVTQERKKLTNPLTFQQMLKGGGEASRVRKTAARSQQAAKREINDAGGAQMEEGRRMKASHFITSYMVEMRTRCAAV